MARDKVNSDAHQKRIIHLLFFCSREKSTIQSMFEKMNPFCNFCSLAKVDKVND